MPTTLRQFAVTVKGRPVQFDSDLTDTEALAVIRTLQSTFAQDLLKNASNRRSLSLVQWAWVHKLAVDANKPKPAAVNIGNFQVIIALFAVAGSRLKAPKIHLLTLSGLDLRLSVAGPRSRKPGSVSVTSDAGYGTSVWYGRINTDGSFEPGQACTQEVTDYLVEFAADPAGVAAADGRRSGRCCFCGLQLTDERSLAVGWGRQCSMNYSLPWGNRN